MNALHHILVVDDDPSIRDMLAHALRSLGTVEQAVNGADALRRLGSRKYAVVLLDLHMPLIDGFMVLQTLAIKPGPNGDTPVYVITADTSDHARIRSLQRQAIYFLNKPVPIATLISLVTATLNGVAAQPAAGPPPSAIAAAPDPMNPKKRGG